MSALRWIGKVLLGLLLLLAYIKLVQIVYVLIRFGMPHVIFGTWRSYVFWGFLATFIDAVCVFIMWGLGWIASHFYRPKLFRIIGWIVSAIAFVLSEAQLWQFIDALYYAGFWEYFWGIILTLVILIPYVGLPFAIFYSPSAAKKEEQQ